MCKLRLKVWWPNGRYELMPSQYILFEGQDNNTCASTTFFVVFAASSALSLYYNECVGIFSVDEWSSKCSSFFLLSFSRSIETSRHYHPYFSFYFSSSSFFSPPPSLLLQVLLCNGQGSSDSSKDSTTQIRSCIFPLRINGVHVW